MQSALKSGFLSLLQMGISWGGPQASCHSPDLGPAQAGRECGSRLSGPKATTQVTLNPLRSAPWHLLLVLSWFGGWILF